MAVALRRKHLFQFYWCGSAPFFKAHLLSMVLDDFEKNTNFRLQIELFAFPLVFCIFTSKKAPGGVTKCEAYY